MSTTKDENQNDFLDEFSNYTSVFDQFDDGKGADKEWTRKCFGRGEHLRKDFKSHLSDHFLAKCSGENGDHSFDQFKITSGDILRQIDERYICDNCRKSRRFFCYTCFSLSPQLAPHLPTIHLPIRIDIIKHVKEIDGKSTATHAVVLAPNEVRFFNYPTLPDDWPEDRNKVLLVFPRKGSTPTVTEYLANHFSLHFPDENVVSKHLRDSPQMNSPCSHMFAFPFERVVFIDSTWRQSKSMSNDPRIKCLPAVVIDAQETRFWRCGQSRPVHFLSTIEAIYYFCLQLHHFMADLVARHSSLADNQLLTRFSPYEGQYDNLLFFFKHTYNIIKKRYHL